MKLLLLVAIVSLVAIGLFPIGVGIARQQPPAGSSAMGVPQDPAAIGYLNLHKRHPDADEGTVEFNRAYSSDLALNRMTQVEGFLESFRKLTDKVRSRLTPPERKTIGNIDSDMQTIGFHNIPLIIEGALLKQEYQLRQTEYELAQLKRDHGNATAQEVEAKRTAYAKATKALQIFWDTKLPTD